MAMNLRCDDRFAEDEGWHRAAERYESFLRTRRGQKLLFLELGVGYNTPVIIKYPFWRMTAANPRAVYACLNLGQAAAPRRFRSSPSASTGTSAPCWPVWAKILLSLQVWNLFAFGEQILRAADCKPFVKKGEALF